MRHAASVLPSPGGKGFHGTTLRLSTGFAGPRSRAMPWRNIVSACITRMGGEYPSDEVQAASWYLTSGRKRRSLRAIQPCPGLYPGRGSAAQLSRVDLLVAKGCRAGRSGSAKPIGARVCSSSGTPNRRTICKLQTGFGQPRRRDFLRPNTTWAPCARRAKAFRKATRRPRSGSAGPRRTATHKRSSDWARHTMQVKDCRTIINKLFFGSATRQRREMLRPSASWA